MYIQSLFTVPQIAWILDPQMQSPEFARGRVNFEAAIEISLNNTEN